MFCYHKYIYSKIPYINSVITWRWEQFIIFFFYETYYCIAMPFDCSSTFKRLKRPKLNKLSLPPEARRPFFTSVRTFTQSLSAVMLFLQVRLVLSHIFIHLSFLLMQNIHHLICIDTRLLFHVFHCFCLPFLSIDHTLIAQSSPAERSRLRLKGEYRKFLYFLL